MDLIEDAYGSSQMGSQFESQDFCTPQDQDIKQKSELQIAESLQLARMPAKKAKTGGRQAQNGESHYEEVVLPCSVNPLLPKNMQADSKRKSATISTSRSPFLEV
jgi:hypothetical protein